MLVKTNLTWLCQLLEHPERYVAGPAVSSHHQFSFEVKLQGDMLFRRRRHKLGRLSSFLGRCRTSLHTEQGHTGAHAYILVGQRPAQSTVQPELADGQLWYGAKGFLQYSFAPAMGSAEQCVNQQHMPWYLDTDICLPAEA